MTAAAAGAAAPLSPALGGSIVAGEGPIPRRPLGGTGERLSFIGFGGIVVSGVDKEFAAGIVREAYEGGINYFDVAPTYGNAEEMLGPALEPFRKDCFLACKTTQRKAADARKELERSLKLLKTDHFDLYQLHALTSDEDIETAFGPGGAMEVFLKAKRDGLVRFLGFSAHSVEAALAAMERYDFDTVLFPLNYVTWHAGNFGSQVVSAASERGMGILALKAMARSPWPEDMKRSDRSHPKCWYEPLADPEEAMLGLRFTLSQPVTAALPPGDPDLFRLAMKLAPSFLPLSPGDKERIEQKAAAAKPIFSYPRA
ncbi:aldo/keto reductase [candidate division KSB1 bacterium]